MTTPKPIFAVSSLALGAALLGAASVPGAKTGAPSMVLLRGLFDHVHLKDSVFDAEGKPVCVPIGEGKTPLKAQIEALVRDGYRGIYTLETRYTPKGGTAMQGTEATLAGLKKILAEAGLS